MPRTGRGGARDGAIGGQYANRTDLSQGKLPVKAAPNQAYGEAGAQRAAQGVVPMGTPSISTSFPQTAQQSSQAPAQFPSMVAPQVQPGSLPYLHPTNRPDEPVTAGLPFGPGAGPAEARTASVSDMLSSLATGTHASALFDLAATARSLGQ